MTELRSPLQAQVVQWLAAPGGAVRAGDVVVILEAMKMEHEVRSPGDGRVRRCLFDEGEAVQEGEVLLVLEATSAAPQGAPSPTLPQRGREEEQIPSPSGGPAETRDWLARGLATAGVAPEEANRAIDTW